MKIKHFNFIVLIISVFSIKAQQLRQPFEFPILLSGNFGELRNNHFHSGIDFKTQGVEGKAVHAVQDGYISRISVSPGGYGNALYLTHPNGITTVYGHLQRFIPSIAQYVKEKQYEQENFNVNLSLTPEEFPFHEGEIIAYSGNTGSSGGPHLHFEIRDTKSEDILDPLEYFKDKIKDTRPPKIQSILVCPIKGKGIVNDSQQKVKLELITTKDGKQTFNKKIEAWGEIGLAIKTNDYMDNTSNIYGVKEISLYLDSIMIYHSNPNRFAFDESRYLNSYIDYEEWKLHHSFYIRSFIEPGNRLRFIKSKNHGIIHINEEKTYSLTYTLSDLLGNTTKQTIHIIGKRQEIPEISVQGKDLFHWRSDNRFGAKGIRLTIPKGNLYNDFYFQYKVKEDSLSFANIHILHDKPIPIHKSALLSLRLRTDTLVNKKQYGIVRIHKGKKHWIGGKYRNGWIDTSINELGSYTISQDTKAPVITPVLSKTWINKQRFIFRLTDNLSGVKTYRGEIDGQFVLFEMNNQSVISYQFDKNRLKKGKHTLNLIVTDAVGNQSEYSYPFVW